MATKMTPFTLTLRWLYNRGACFGQRNQFESLFGKQVLVTEALIRKHGWHFATNWLVLNLCGNAAAVDHEDRLLVSWYQYRQEKETALFPIDFRKNGLRRIRINYTARAEALALTNEKRLKREANILIAIFKLYPPRKKK